MPARGDYDTIVPGMKFVRDGLEIGRDRCKKLLRIGRRVHHGSQLVAQCRCVQLGGMPAHLRYHQLATVELPAIMAETYEHTRDAKFLDKSSCPAPMRS